MGSGDVPEDVVIDILSRLPVKSLVRFRCVCKSWYALIKNPSFIAKHLLLNPSTTLMNNNNASLLIKRRHSITEWLMLSLLSNETVDFSVNLEFRFLEEAKYEEVRGFPLKILGPCNGIFCLYTGDQTLVLWNPAIREFKALPLSRLCLRPDLEPKATYVSIGFGMDPKTHDFKLVRFLLVYYEGSLGHTTLIELYTHSSGSWKEIDATAIVPLLSYIDYRSCCDTCYTKGIFNWWSNDVYGAVILSFDMGEEVFVKTPLPDIGASWNKCSWSLAVLKESVALVVYPSEGTEKWFDIWVLNEYGLKESWTKQLTIGPLLGVESFLGFWNSDECVMESKTGQLVSYHLSTQEIKDLQVHGMPGSLQFVYYMESLVSIKGGYEHEQQDNSSDIVPLPFSVRELGQEEY